MTSATNGRRVRNLATVAGLWSSLYLVIAFALGDGPVWWYLVLVGLGVAFAVQAAFRGGVIATTSALVSLILATLLGLASIGLLLVPAVVAMAVAVSAAVSGPKPRLGMTTT